MLKSTSATLLSAGLLTTTASASTASNRPSHHAHGRRNVVDIVAGHDHDAGEHRFDFSTTEVPAGWRTATLHNETEHTHFAYFAKLPQVAIDEADNPECSRSVLEHYKARVTYPFQYFMDTLVPDKEPNPDDRYQGSDDPLFPEWFGSVMPSGGPGLVSPGGSATTTMQLDPGRYIVECYVKNGSNEFHSYDGMIDLLTVVEGDCGAEPQSTLSVSVSADGIDAPDTVRPGRHTVAVEFLDQQVYSHLLGHDVHLVRLDEGTTVEDVSGWMNWMDPTQFVSDGTEPGTFVGGVETILTPGLLDGSDPETAYVDVYLTSGEYAWVAEVPDPLSKGLLARFGVEGSCEG